LASVNPSTTDNGNGSLSAYINDESKSPRPRPSSSPNSRPTSRQKGGVYNDLGAGNIWPNDA